MKVFNNLGEMKPFYNAKTNTYEFIEDGRYLDVKFEFNVVIMSSINAKNIKAGDIDARNISYYAVCFAYNGFSCKSATGRRKNAKHFCLDSEIEYKNEEEN